VYGLNVWGYGRPGLKKYWTLPSLLRKTSIIAAMFHSHHSYLRPLCIFGDREVRRAPFHVDQFNARLVVLVSRVQVHPGADQSFDHRDVAVSASEVERGVASLGDRRRAGLLSMTRKKLD